MRVSEIINKMLDWSEGAKTLDQPTLEKTHQEYANAPHEVTQGTQPMFSQGDDVNKPKHPSDIRADSFSMYPNHQHNPKD